MNNGFSSEYFNIRRGVRQGCPLSPYLFILCAEILATPLKNDDDIQGIKIDDTECKLSQYADDTSLLLQDEESTRKALGVVQKFGEISGLKMNVEKTKIALLGKPQAAKIENARKLCRELHTTLETTEIDVLGIVLPLDGRDIVAANLEKPLQKIKNIMKTWKQRQLTPIGRICLIKSLLASQLTYRQTVIPLPKSDFYEKLEKEMFEFIWQKKKDKIARNTLKKELEEGGLKMLDLQSFIKNLKIKWIKKIAEQNNRSKWKTIWKKEMDRLGVGNILEFNLKKPYDVLQNIRLTSLKEAMNIWYETSYTAKDEVTQPNSQTIWWNSCITSQKKPIFNAQWKEKGIQYIHQLYENKRLLNFAELKRRYQLTNQTFLDYIKVIACIPKEWKKIMEEVQEEASPLPIQKVTAQENKAIYIKMKKLKTAKADPNNQIKWQEYLATTDIRWEKCYILGQRIINTAYYKYFQYRVMHRAIYFRKTLFKMKKVTTPFCIYCENNALDTIEHGLIECPTTRNFKQLCFTKMETQMPETKDWLLGDPNRGIDYNTFMLLVKHFIYKMKLAERRPEEQNLKNYMKQQKDIEEFINRKHKKMEIHKKKWAIIEKFIETA